MPIRLVGPLSIISERFETPLARQFLTRIRRIVMKPAIFFLCSAAFGIFVGLTESATGGENEFSGRTECSDSSLIIQKLQINFGVQTEKLGINGPVAVISIPITRNQDQYLGCLEMRGKNTEVAKIAYFQNRDRCRREALSPTVLISASDHPALISGFDTQKYERCLHGNDKPLEVELIGE
jgi:hypothetical protein